MAEDNAIESFNVKGLDQMLKAFKGKPPVARVGVLGSTDSRGGKMNSNATIGAAHEFGTSKMPQRSFLRVPISENLQKELDSSGAINKDTTEEMLKEGSLVPYVEKLGAIGVSIVLDAFATGGGGKWPAWKDPTYKNNTGQLLLDTTQLRNSIAYDVKT